MLQIDMTWRQLRKLAEAAHGFQQSGARMIRRGGQVTIESPEKVLPLAASQTDAPQSNEEVVLTVSSQPIAAKAKTLQIVLNDVRIEGTTYGDIAGIADAMFWSLAAVEKFLLPYYIGFEDIDVVREKVRDRFKQPNVLAMVHLPRSEWVDIETRKLAGFTTASSELQILGPGAMLAAIEIEPNSGHKILTRVL